MNIIARKSHCVSVCTSSDKMSLCIVLLDGERAGAWQGHMVWGGLLELVSSQAVSAVICTAYEDGQGAGSHCVGAFCCQGVDWHLQGIWGHSIFLNKLLHGYGRA